MSGSCCCCLTPSGELLEGTRKRERLVGGEEQQDDSRGNMDISLLREQYRCTRERQKRHTQVLLFRTVSGELSEAVSIIPVTQSLTSPWEPNSSSPPSLSFDPDPSTYDPWHVHLGLHRRCCPGVSALTASSSKMTNTNSSSRRSSSSSEAVTWQQDVDSTSWSPTEEDYFNPRGDPDSGSSERPRGDPEKADPVEVCVSGSLQVSGDLPEDSISDHQCSAAGSDESSTPVASITCSPSSSTTSLYEDLKENRSAGTNTNTDNSVLQNSSSLAWSGSRKFSAPVLRLTRQLSVGGVGSSGGVHQGHIYQPFPNRKTPRISEAARRLGMYSSF